MVTVSLGVAQDDPANDSSNDSEDDSADGLNALLAAADKALYAAKNNGRNRVERA